MDKSKAGATEVLAAGTTFYAFTKDNKPDGKYSVFEVWENGHPDKVVTGQKIEFTERTFSEEQLDILIPYWRNMSSEAGFNEPMLTIQGDISNGCELVYRYKDNREEIPPNAKFYTIKPVFDENITTVRHAGKQGKSLVYHSPLNSPTLREEIMNFNKLLISFFNGEFYKILAEHSDRNPGWEFCNEVVIANAKLRST